MLPVNISKYKTYIYSTIERKDYDFPQKLRVMPKALPRHDGVMPHIIYCLNAHKFRTAMEIPMISY